VDFGKDPHWVWNSFFYPLLAVVATNYPKVVTYSDVLVWVCTTPERNQTVRTMEDLDEERCEAETESRNEDSYDTDRTVFYA
jgi:hypothetical protein